MLYIISLFIQNSIKNKSKSYDMIESSIWQVGEVHVPEEADEIGKKDLILHWNET